MIVADRQIRTSSIRWVLVLALCAGLFLSGQHDARARVFDPGTRIQCGAKKTIYYVASDGHRYVFPNSATYKTWYSDFDDVVSVPAADCADMPLGGNVTAKPGAVLLTLPYSNAVYAVSAPNVLHHVMSEDAARELYGPRWNRRGRRGSMRTLVESFFINYTIGEPIVVAADYDRNAALAACPTINECLGFGAPPTQPTPSPTPPSPPVPPSPPEPPTPPAPPSPPDPFPESPPPPTGDGRTVGITDHRILSSVLTTKPPQVSGGKVPALGAWITDPTFKTQFRRVSDAVSEGDYAIHYYSQLQAFSPSSEYYLTNEEAGDMIRSTETLKAVDGLSIGGNILRWHPTIPNTIVWYDSNADDRLRLTYTDVETKQSLGTFTFPSQYEGIRVNNASEEMSHNGQWTAGMASTKRGTDQEDSIIFALDVTKGLSDQWRQAIGAEMTIASLYNGPCTPDPTYGNVDPDWVAISPKGTYLMVQWARDGFERCSGLELYDAQTGAYVTHVRDRHDHSDHGIDAKGREFVLSVAPLPAGLNPGQVDEAPSSHVIQYILPETPQDRVTSRFIKSLPLQGFWHVSCQGPNGICLVTAYYPESTWDPKYPGIFDDELYMLWLEDGSYRRIAHHRSSGCGYWVQPRASWSKDGQYVIWDSDFAVETGGADSCAKANFGYLGGGDVYIMKLPEEALVNPRNAGPYTRIVTETPSSGNDSSAGGSGNSSNESGSSNTGLQTNITQDADTADTSTNETDTSSNQPAHDGNTGAIVSSLPSATHEDLEFTKVPGGSSGQIMMRLDDFLTDSGDTYCLDEGQWDGAVTEEVYVKAAGSDTYTVPAWTLDYHICQTRRSREYLLTPAQPGSYDVSICVTNAINGWAHCSESVTAVTN